MDIDNYQEQAKTTQIFQDEVANLYLTLGLIGEAVEVAEVAMKAIERSNLGENSMSYALTMIQLGELVRQGKALERTKKLIRDGGIVNKDKDYEWVKKIEFTEEEKNKLSMEIGDVSWYLSGLSGKIGLLFSEVFSLNLKKLFKRKAEDKIKGSGDNR